MLKFADNHKDEKGNFTGRFCKGDWVILLENGKSYQINSCHGWQKSYACYGYCITDNKGTIMHISEVDITHDLIKLRESLCEQ
jgi:hypothetical protein